MFISLTAWTDEGAEPSDGEAGQHNVIGEGRRVRPGQQGD